MSRPRYLTDEKINNVWKIEIDGSCCESDDDYEPANENEDNQSSENDVSDDDISV